MSVQPPPYRLDRRYPSPSAQRRSGELWKARFGLVAVVLVTLASAVLMFRIAGVTLGGLLGTAPKEQQARPAPTPPAPAAQRPASAGTTAQAQPAAGAAVAQAAPATPQPTAAPAATPTSSSSPKREHVVERGDSLFAIARQYGTTVDALMAANGIRDRSQILSVGQKLAVP